MTRKRRNRKKEPSCPICKSKNISHQEGCMICMDCGWTSCNL